MITSSQQEWTIGRLLDTASGYWQPCALHAGVKLDLFTAVGEGWLAAAEIIGKLKADARGGEILLNALAAMGLLLKSEGQFANSEFARTYLCDSLEVRQLFSGSFHAPNPSPCKW